MDKTRRTFALLVLNVVLLAVLFFALAIVRTDSARVMAAAGAWQAMNTVDAPDGRYGHSAIWTGEQMLVWGGYYHLDHFLNDGALYHPVDDTWTPITTTNAPMGRLRHTAVWSGTAMLVWGGESGSGGTTTNTGGIYTPLTDTWTPITTTDAPTPREMHSAVWTGSEMIVWGGCDTVDCSTVYNDGGRYDPASDIWTPITSTLGATSRHFHQAFWTGDKMLVWGGSSDPSGYLYDPLLDSWEPITTTNAPDSTFVGSGVWTGSEMLTWGGCTVYTTAPCPSYVGTGGVYDPAVDTWSPITTTDAPEARWSHSAVWTGSEMIVWGGCGSSCLDMGGLYDPVLDAWTPVETAGAPAPRSYHQAVWSGEVMVAWGGCDLPGCGAAGYFNSGGRFDPAATPPTATPSSTVTATEEPTATPTETLQASPTPTATLTATPTISVTQVPSATATTTPTATTIPSSDGYLPVVVRQPTLTPTPTPTQPPPTPTPTEPPATSTPTVTLTPPPTPIPSATATSPPSTTGDVRIQTIFYNGAGSQEPDEYVQIRNFDQQAIQLQGWTLRDIANHVFTFPNFTIQPGQDCRIYTNEFHPEHCGFNYGSGSAIWNNTGDCAYLRDASSQLVDQYSYLGGSC